MSSVELENRKFSAGSLKRRLASAAAATALLTLMPMQSALAAENAADDMFADLDVVSDGELAENRGGFSVGGFSISFGVTVTTSISGPNINPVVLTTNFVVNTPGDMQNLGTTITGAVTTGLMANGVIDDGDPSTPTIGDQIAGPLEEGFGGNPPNAPAEMAAGSGPSVPDPVDVAQNEVPSLGDIVSDLPDPGAGGPSGDSGSPTTGTQNSNTQNAGAGTGSEPTGNNVVQNAQSAASSFVASVDAATGTVSLSNGATNVLLQTVGASLALIENTDNNVQLTSHIAANYVIGNYSELARASQLVSQLTSINDQLLAIHHIVGF